MILEKKDLRLKISDEMLNDEYSSENEECFYRMGTA